MGANRCKAGNKTLETNQSAELKHGDCIELLEGQYPYEVHFTPDPTKSVSSLEDQEMASKQTTLNTFFKRKSSEESETSNISKKQKTENIWEEIDNGKLIIYTIEGVQPSEKVVIITGLSISVLKLSYFTIAVVLDSCL